MFSEFFEHLRAFRRARQDPPEVRAVADALHLLYRPYGENSSRELHHYGNGPEIRVEWFGGHYDTFIRGDTYPLAPEVLRVLLDEQYIDGKPEWGYTSSNEFRISERGIAEYFATLRQKQTERDDLQARVADWESEGGAPLPAEE